MQSLQESILKIECKILQSNNIKEIKKLEKKLDKLNNICNMLDIDNIEYQFLICN